MNTIGQRLKKLGEGVRQDDFAKNIGINKNTLRAYEKDRNSPSVDTIISIAEKLGISGAWLAFGIGPMHREDATGPPLEPPQPKQEAAYSGCERLETDNRELKTDLSKERDMNRELVVENRELNKENRELWKDNGNLREKCARMEERGNRAFINMAEQDDVA